LLQYGAKDVDRTAEFRRLEELHISTTKDRCFSNVTIVGPQNTGFPTVLQGDLENWVPSDTSIILDALRTRIFIYLPQLQYAMLEDASRSPAFTTSSAQFVVYIGLITMLASC